MDWVIHVSGAERAAGRLNAATEAAAESALREHGCLLLRGVFLSEAIDRLKADFDRQWGGLTDNQMLAKASMPAPNPVLRVGDGRYEVLLKMKGAFLEPGLYANNLLCSLLASALDRDMRLSGFTAVMSFPASKQQHIHTDAPRLFGNSGPSSALPHYAINVAVPLIDVSAEIGVTGIWMGSHLWDPLREARQQEVTSVEFLRGDCILIDYRTMHAGLPNNSSVVRPILYMVYARPWFFDELNHRGRPSLDMDIDDYARLEPPVKNLLMRAFSQRLRAQYLTNAATIPS